MDMAKPIIRFKGYQDDWEQRKLPEFVSFFNGLTYTPDDVQETGTLVLRSSNVKNGEIVDADNVYVSDNVATSENVQEGDIIVVVRNGSRALIGKHAQIKASMPNTVIGAFMSGIRSEYSSFVNALLDTSAFENEVAKNMGATINQITGYMFSKMEFMIPSEEEQQKIGEYFSNLDHLITLHQRKCDETKRLKKYLLQKMFPQNGEKAPEIRFSGFTDDWEQRKLGDVCEIKDSARIPNSEWSESGIPYIRASDVTNENIDGVLFISQERYEFYKKRTGAPTKDDVLFNGGGEIGKSLLIADENPIYVQGGAVLYACTSESSELVGQYLKIYFETTHAKSYIDAASAGGTMKHFTLKPSQMMPILMPSVDEQEKLGIYFSNLDNLITLHQRELENLQNIKRFMLEKMFV